MKTLMLLALCATTLGAQLSNGKSPRVLEIEQKFHLTFDRMASADNDIWWLFFQTPITPIVVHIDASDEEVSSAIETSITTAKLIFETIKAEGKPKKK